MATPADPQKTLLTNQRTIDAAQAVINGQSATVRQGQVLGPFGGFNFTFTVANGAVTNIVRTAV